MIALSFAFPEAVVRPLVPSVLSLDTFEGFAFVTVAMVWTRALRPAGLPTALGRDFFLAGYRVFTRLQEPGGRRLRGLRILQSVTDKRFMVWSGNLLTRYNYSHAVVSVREQVNRVDVTTTSATGRTTIDLAVDVSAGDVALPDGSPFPDWAAARRFAGPMPFTFSPEGDGTVVVVEGSREHWQPRPVRVLHWNVAMFGESPLSAATPILANAFMVEDVDYRWSAGRIVRMTGEPS